MKPYGSIYLILNDETCNVYIGKTRKPIQKRLKEHIKNTNCGMDYHLHRAIRKHGAENFTIELLGTANSHEALNKLEIHWIAAYDSFLGDGYNMTPGGDGGCSIGPRNGRYGKGHLIRGENNPNYGNGAKIAGEKNYWYGIKGPAHPSYGKPGLRGENSPMYGVEPWNKGKTGCYSEEYIQNCRESSKGSNNANSKLAEDDVRLIKNLLLEGVRVQDIAKQFKVCTATIKHIRTGRFWKHVN